MGSSEQTCSQICSKETIIPTLLSNPNLMISNARAYQNWILMGLDLEVPQNLLKDLKQTAKSKGDGLLHGIVTEVIQEWFRERIKKGKNALLNDLIVALKDNHLEIFADALQIRWEPVKFVASTEATPVPKENEATRVAVPHKFNLSLPLVPLKEYEEEGNDDDLTPVVPRSRNPTQRINETIFIKEEIVEENDNLPEDSFPFTSFSSIEDPNTHLFVHPDNASTDKGNEKENEVMETEMQQKQEQLLLSCDEDGQIGLKRKSPDNNDMIRNDSVSPSNKRRRSTTDAKDYDGDKSGYNDLNRAIQENRISDVIRFINEGADVNKKVDNYSRNSPLHMAALYIHEIHDCLEVAKALIYKGANLFAQNSRNITFMEMIFNDSAPEMKDSQFHDFIEFLIANGHSKILITPFFGNGGGSVMQLAMKKRVLGRQTIKLLNYKNVDMNHLSLSGNSLFYYAIWGERSIDMIKYLIEHTVEWRIVNKTGWNILHVAGRFCHEDAFEYFLMKDRTLADQKNKDGNTPIDLIRKYHKRSQRMKNILKENGISYNW